MRTLLPAEVNKVPNSIDEWKNQARLHQIFGSIDKLGSKEKVKPASKFEFEHFLGLRVIYKFSQNNATSSILPLDIREHFPVSPDLALETIPGWHDYLDQIRDFSADDLHVGDSVIAGALGPWAPVWQYQMHVLLGGGKCAELTKLSDVSPMGNQSKIGSLASDDEGSDSGLEPSPGDPTSHDLIDQVFSVPFVDIEGRPMNDDKTPNVFFLLFLSSITANIVPFHTHWLGEPKAMVYEPKVRYAARTDGYLRGKAGGTHTLIDIIPRTRTQMDMAIRMQESAQVTA